MESRIQLRSGAQEREHLPARSRNRLLTSLNPSDYSLLAPHLEPTTLRFRQHLDIEQRKIETAYFIESGLASVIATSHLGRRQAEVAVIGCEGMTAVAVVLGADRSPNEILMQIAGKGLAIGVDDLRRMLNVSSTLRTSLTRYAHYLSVLMSQSALANAQGTIEERLARWLLMAQDRLDGSDVNLTHELLSLMLGVRRAGITTAIHSLERQGCVATARGAVRILDRPGLVRHAGGLYGVAETEFERLFPPLVLDG